MLVNEFGNRFDRLPCARGSLGHYDAHHLGFGRFEHRFQIDGKLPTTVIIVTTTAVYTQCPKALIRSHLWDPSRHRDASELPSVGDIMAVITAGAFDGKAYDDAYPERIRQTIY